MIPWKFLVNRCSYPLSKNFFFSVVPSHLSGHSVASMMLMEAAGSVSMKASTRNCVLLQLVLTVLSSIFTLSSSDIFSYGYLDMASASAL